MRDLRSLLDERSLDLKQKQVGGRRYIRYIMTL